MDADQLLDALVRHLGAEAETGAPNGRLYAEALVAAHLVADYAEGGRTTPTGGLPAAALRRAEAYLRAHVADDVALADEADAAGYSVYHFAREHRIATGEAPFEMLRRLRMEAAQALLADLGTAHWSVAAVASEVRYASASAFASAFRVHAGLSPAAYRRQARR